MPLRHWALVAAALLAGCGGGDDDPGAETSASGCVAAQAPDPREPARHEVPTSTLDPAATTRAVVVTNCGEFTITLDPRASPNAASSFAQLASHGYFDDTVFHRIVPGFVIQGGDPTGTGTGGPGYTIQDEPVTTDYARGTVAMARTPAPNSVGSQFFIVLDDAAAQSLADPSANNYQILGSVTDGMDAVDAIAAAADAESPSDPVEMDRVVVTQVTE